MRKTPNKWAVRRPKLKPIWTYPRLETEGLGSQKKTKRLGNRGRAKKKEEEELKEQE